MSWVSAAVGKRLYTPLHKPSKVLLLGEHTVELALLRSVFERRARCGRLEELGLREADLREPIQNRMDTGLILRAVRPVCQCAFCWLVVGFRYRQCRCRHVCVYALMIVTASAGSHQGADGGW
jgi:hypothetical protein